MTTPAMTDLDRERALFEAWYAKRHPTPVHENTTWAHASKMDDLEVWQARAALPQQVVAGSIDSPEFSALAARYGTTKAGKDYMALIAYIDARQAAPVKAVALCQTQDETAAGPTPQEVANLIYRHTGLNARQFPDEYADCIRLCRAVLDADAATVPGIPGTAQQQAGAVPDGYALVPLVPSEDMIVAFAEVWYSKVRCFDDPEMDDAYAAMLAAATDEEKES